MNKQKNVVMSALIYAIVLAVYNIVIFTIFKTHTNVFWLSYGFMTLAFVVQIVSVSLAFRTTDVETAFFGIPLASFSIFYLGAEFFVSLVFMIFQVAGMTLATVIQVVLLAAFLVIAIISLMTRDTVKEITDTFKQNVANLKSVGVDIEMLMVSCADPELKVALRKVSETVKYSDPMTNETVTDVEQRIHRKVSELCIYFDDNQIDEAKKACSELELLFAERNKRLLISK